MGTLISLIRILRIEKPNIVHTHTSKAGLIGRIASLIASPEAKRMHTYHGHLLYGYFGIINTFLITLLERILAKISDCLISVSQHVKIELLNSKIGLDSDWRVIRPGVISMESERLSSRSKFQFHSDEIVILWVGRFTKIKNPLLALKAFAILTENIGNHYTLMMVGDGELVDECRHFIEINNLNVKIMGWVDDPSEVVNASDLLLMSSSNEGMPLVIVEAASAGVPTLSTQVGGVGEFIEHGVTGFLCEKDVSSLAESIFSVTSDLENLKRVGQRAKLLYEMQFSSKVFVESHKRLYQEILENRS